MMRDAPCILLIGATGMVGEAVLAQARLPVHYLARRPAKNGAAHHAIICGSDRWADEIAALKPDILISSLGTTMRQAGSQEAFRAIDHDLQIAAADAARQSGAERFIGVSSVGASAHSSSFYLRTKGEVERTVAAMAFRRTDVLRPGLLRGERQGRPRLAEGLAMMAAPLTDALLHGALRKYRSVPAVGVAAAIWVLTSRREPGHFLHESDAIIALAD